jgi:tetratricopeptide (TPR) repeat protein
MVRNILKIIAATALLNFIPFFILNSQQPVKVWEETLVIPTYQIKPADVNPMFFKGDVYQGASKVIYPYALMDNLGNEKTDKSYNAVYLENEFVKICVLPELGGKFYDAVDKTNDYHFLYCNHVIKAANIGMLGAWLSGGIEWCVIHHHRASTFMPVDHYTTENPDGSKTIWIGETEPRQRMRWIIGLTSFPGKSYIEAQVKIFNRMAETNTFLYFANVATYANTNYRVVFPPSTDFAVYHAKNSFTHWPISAEVYNGVDYTRGVDLSWWKNHPEPISFFAYDLKENFMGGYDHNKNAGTVHVGDHNIVKGAKLWEWGPSEYAQMWDKVLTDSDGPYAEIMVGAFSDNQPDYSWIRPYETKTFKQYWYPVRDIGGFRKATLEGAVNLEMMAYDQLKYGFYVTGAIPDAHIILSCDGKVLSEDVKSLDPTNAFVKTIKLPKGIKETSIKASLSDKSGKEILAFQPQAKERPEALPPIVTAPPPPSSIKTVEELFLTGQRIAQFHNPTIDPLSYMDEALRRDPAESRVNTWMGNYSMKKGMNDDAANYFRKAIGRIAHDYTRPANCEAFFGLGLALKNLAKYPEAIDTLYRASWDYAWHSAAYYQLACISVLQNKPDLALEQVDKSLSTNSINDQAIGLKASILRNLGKPDKALELLEIAFQKDPLDFRLGYERLLCLRSFKGSADVKKEETDLATRMRGSDWSWMELADDYIQAGLFNETSGVLEEFVKAQSEKKVDPMVYYTLAWLYNKSGDKLKMNDFLNLAAAQSTDYCFPYMNGSIAVLEKAIELRPGDARAIYYLGNLLYDKQPQRAMKCWESSVKADPSLAIAWRNLGWGSWYTEKNASKAITYYERAIRLKSDDPVYYCELDKMYEKNNTDINTRLKLLESKHEVVVQRDDAFLREIRLLTLAGRASEAVEYLSNRHFHVREGDEHMHDCHIDAYLLMGTGLLDKGKTKEAIAAFNKALEYPENEQAGKPLNEPRWAQINYYLGLAWQKEGRQTEANKYFNNSANQQIGFSENSFYQALSQMALGDKEKAMGIFQKLMKEGEASLNEMGKSDFFAKFGERQTIQEKQADAHYLKALGLFGMGEKEKAKAELQAALNLNNSLVWAAELLKQSSN